MKLYNFDIYVSWKLCEIVKKILYIIGSLLKSLLILWLPILLIEETFLFNYIISDELVIIFSIIIIVLCLFMYIKTYKKIKRK